MDYAALAANPELLARARQQQAILDAQAVTTNRNRTTGEVVGDIGTQLLQGAVGLGQAAYGVGNIATLGLLDRGVGLSRNFADTNQILESWKSDPTQAAKARGSAAFDEGIGQGLKEYITDPALLQDLFVSNIPSLIPAGAGAQFAMRNAIGAEQIAKYAARGASRAGAIQAGGSADVSTINAAREAGMSETEAQLAGLGSGVLTGVMTGAVTNLTGAARLEGLAAARLLGHKAPMSLAGQTIVKSIAGGAAREGVEESIQSGGETAIQNAFTGKDITEGVAQSLALGALAGTVLGGGLGVYTGPRKTSQQRTDVTAALAENARAAGVDAAPSALARPEFELTPPVPMEAATGIPFERVPGLSAAEQRAQGTLDFGTQAPPRAAGDITFKPAEFEPYMPAGMSTPIPMGGPVQQPLIVTDEGQVGTPEQIAATRDLLNDPLYYAEFAKGQQRIEAAKQLVSDPQNFDRMSRDHQLRVAEQLLDGQHLGTIVPTPTATWLPGEPPVTGEPGQQPDLFSMQPLNFGQAMTARKRKAAEDAAARVSAALSTVRDATINPEPIQQAIDQRLQARQAGMSEGDLLSIEDIVRERMFTHHPDGTITKWNPALQVQEEVTPAQADEEVKAATSWKEFMVKQLGLRPGDLQGKAWKAFNDAANDAGVLPVSDAAAEFLSTYAGTIDPGADLTKFALKVHEKFAPVEEEPAPAVTPADLLLGATPTPAVPTATAAPVPAAAAPVPVSAPGVPTVAPASAEASVPGPAPAGAPSDELPVFAMGKQDKDLHSYVDGGQKVTFYKDMDSGLWQWEHPASGESGVFDSPTRVDAKMAIADIVEQRGSTWGTRAQMAGEVDLTHGVTRTKFSAKQFNEESKRAIQVATESDEGEFAHVAYLDYVQQAFDATGATEALRKSKDYAIKRAKELFSSGEDSLTPAGLKKLQENIAASYNERHAYIVSRAGEGGIFKDDAKFSRANTESGNALHQVLVPQHVERVQQVVDFANTSSTPQEARVQLFNTVKDFLRSRPLEFGENDLRVPADTKGVYIDDGTVVLIAENLKDDKDAAMTILHERTHEGFAGLLGNNVSAVTNRLWANAGMRKRIKDKMQLLGLDRATAAEEVLTDMQERNERLTGDVRSKLMSGVTRAFDTLLGSREISITPGDIDALLDDVVRYRTKGVSTPTSRMAYGEAMAHIDTMIEGAPDKLTSIRLSRAIEDLGRITGPSSAEPVDNASSVIAGAAKDTMSYVSGLVSAVKTGSLGKVPRELYRFVGVSQLHATFRNLWTDAAEDGTKTNTYDNFAKDYAAHADERNRLIYSVGEISRELDAMRTKSPERSKKLNAMVQYSTFYQLYPGAAAQPDAVGIDPVERKEALTLLNSLWKQVGTEGQVLFGKMQEAYNTAFKTRYQAIMDSLASVKGIDLDNAGQEELAAFKKEFGNLIQAQIHRIGHAPYSPLKRFGDFMVDVRDSTGKQVEFTGHDSEAEALKFAADQRARYGTGHKVSTSLRSEFNLSLDGVNHETVNKIKNGVQSLYPVVEVNAAMPADKQQAMIDRNRYNAEMRAATETVLLDAYLHSIPQHSLMQGANARKYVAGFPLDASRAFNSYMVSFASNVANIKYGAAISKDLADMAAFVRKRGEGNDEAVSMMNVLNAVRGQYDGGKEVEFSPVAEKLTMASFVFMMTSPSQMLMNGLQTPLVAAPRLGAKFGTGKSMRALAAAGKLFFSAGGVAGDTSALPQVTQVLEELHRTGMDDFTLASTMSGLAAGRDSDAHTIWRSIVKVAAYGMHKSEVFNRQITAHAFATLRAEQDPAVSYDELLRDTKDFIENQSHFNYDPHNTPEIMQGPWRKVLFQFQNYRMNMLALLARDIKTAEFGRMLTGKEALDPDTAALARRTLAYTVGTQLALTGAAGTVVSPLIFAIMDAFRDDDDLLDSRTDFVRGNSQILSHGLLAALPVLGVDPTRVESGSILPYFGDRQYVPKDKTPRDEFNYYLARLAGPSAGLVANLWESSAAIAGGDYKTAVKKGLPKPLADAYTAAADFDGVHDSRGNRYYDPSLFDSVKAVVGLKSADRLEAEEKRGAVYRAESHIDALVKRALTKVAIGRSLGDEELQQEGTEKFLALAQAHPETVKPNLLRRAIVGADRAQYNADTYGVGKTGRISQEVLDAVGE